MKLYYHPYGCSLAPMIAAQEAGLPIDLVKVDIMQDPHRLADGADYARLNPKNYVPMLVLDNGETLTEVAVILQYLADLAPHAGLAPAYRAFERVRLQEWLNFLSSELHKFYSPWLFHAELGEVAQAAARQKIAGRYALVEHQLAGKAYLLGEKFSVADAYLFVMVNWAGIANTPLQPFPNIRAWFERMKARPLTAEAVKAHSA